VTALVDQLYRVAVNCPCRCEYRWTKEGYTAVVICTRCEAIERYEREKEVS
jgi:hypothetical protein